MIALDAVKFMLGVLAVFALYLGAFSLAIWYLRR